MAANPHSTPPQPTASASAHRPNQQPDQQLRNGAIAAAAIVLTVLVFFGLRLQTSLPTLSTMAERAVPLEVALANGKPTLVEFYADWCSSCQAMVPTMAEVEKDYGDRVNLVMLNVDNDKWLPEMLAYQVDGIPHFQFLDSRGKAIAHTLGEQPPTIMAANLDALASQTALPHVQTQGRISERDRSIAATSNSHSDPRSHGAQVVEAK